LADETLTDRVSRGRSGGAMAAGPPSLCLMQGNCLTKPRLKPTR